jgi:putative phage-type endonuclease
MQATAQIDRSKFHAERRGVIGGSDAPAVCGVSPYKGALDVYCAKLGLVPPDEREEEFLELGEAMEPYVAARYTREFGVPVTPGRGVLTVHPKWPWMAAHIDAWIEHPERGTGVLEIKSTGFDDEEWESGPPLHITVQHQHQLEAAKASWGVVGVIFGAPTWHLRFFEFERDREFVGNLLDAEASFWRMVETKTPPPATGLDVTVLKKLFPNVNATTIELDAEAVVWDRAFLTADADLKDAKTRRDDAKARLLQLVGENGFGALPGGGGWKRNEISRKGYEVKPTTYCDFRRAAPKGAK